MLCFQSSPGLMCVSSQKGIAEFAHIRHERALELGQIGGVLMAIADEDGFG